MKSKGKSILGVLADVVLIILIIIAILITVMTFTSKASKQNVGNILGYTPFSIQTSSMEPALSKGDLIIAKMYEFDNKNGTYDKDIDSLQKGEVITFQTTIRTDEGDVQQGYNTHRVLDIAYNKDKTINYIITKGDNVNSEDNTKVSPTQVIAKQVGSGIAEDGTYKKGTKITGFGLALDFLQSQIGFMVCIIIPLALFFIWQVYRLIAMFMDAKAENMSEATKKKAIEEYIASQQKNKTSGGSDDPETKQ